MKQETDNKTIELPVDRREEPRLPAVKERKAPAKVQAVAPVQQTTPMDLLRIVTERGATADEIGKFMDLMERQNAAEAKAAFVRAMAAFKKNPPDIYKDKDVAFTGTAYSHATLGNVCEQIIGALAEHGISHDWAMDQPGTGMIRVTCTLTHEMGHSKATSMEAPADNSGKKNPIQSIASTVTYLERYTLLAACGIAVKDGSDDDGRGAGAEQQSASQPKPKLGSKGFAAAVASIKEGSYDVRSLRAHYDLTDEQAAEVAKLEGGQA